MDSSVLPRWALLAVLAPMLLFNRPIRQTSAHVWWGLFLAYCAASALWAFSPWDALGDLAHWLIAFVVFLGAAEDDDPGSAWDGIALGLIPSLIISVFQLSGFQYIVQSASSMPTGLFLNRDFMVEAATIAFVGTAWRRHWLLSLVPLAIIVMSGYRGAYVELGVVAAILCLARLRQTGHRKLPIILAALTPPLMLAALYVDLWANPGRAPSINNRLEMWQVVIFNFVPFGWGLGTIVDQIEYVHSEPLQFILELGIGALLLLALFIAAFRGKDNGLRLVLAVVAVDALFYFPLHLPVPTFAFAVAAGGLAASRRRVRFVRSDWYRAEHASHARSLFDLPAGAIRQAR
jgi:hypothetical protein